MAKQKKQKVKPEKEERDSVDIMVDKFRFAGRKELIREVVDLREYFKSGKNQTPTRVTVEPAVYQAILKRAAERYKVRGGFIVYYGKSVLVPKAFNEAGGKMTQADIED